MLIVLARSQNRGHSLSNFFFDIMFKSIAVVQEVGILYQSTVHGSSGSLGCYDFWRACFRT